MAVIWLATGEQAYADKAIEILKEYPMLNDTNYGHFVYMKELYEFPYRELGGEKLALVLQTYYKNRNRDNLEALLYGADGIEPAEPDWTKAYEMPDSFTIVQWSEENYRTVRMHRKIIWAGEYFVDVFLAEGIPEGKISDWVFHVSGEKAEEKITGNETKKETLPENYFVKKPLNYLQGAKAQKMTQNSVYKKVYRNGKCFTSVYGMGNDQTVITAKGPDNPSMKEVEYLIERRTETAVMAVHVIESWKEQEVIEQVRFKQEGEELKSEIQEKNGAVKRLTI